MDLPSEAPAVAGLLADDFIVPTETAPAILLDLAARRVVELDEIQPGQTICRVRRSHDERLSPAEQRVLTAIQEKAVGGIVPADALTTGQEDQSQKWHRALVGEVVDEAKSSGLTYDRWPRLPTSALYLGAGLVGLLLWLSSEVGGDVSGRRGVTAGIAGAVAIASLAAGCLLVSRWLGSQAQLPTEAGLEAAKRVAGFEAYLHESEMLGELPPAAVKLRGRHLAYAAAFGDAGFAVRLLPMGEEDPRRAWSRFGRRWRRVRVRYPRLFPPAWGKHPGAATALALFWVALTALVYYGTDQITNEIEEFGLTPDQREIMRIAVVLWMTPFLVAVVWALWTLVRAAPDLFQSRTVTGEVVRARARVRHETNGQPRYAYYLAVDNGSDDTVSAWRVRAGVYGSCRQGQTVTAVVTPRLFYVRSLEVSPAEG
jgi:hypothetical protein